MRVYRNGNFGFHLHRSHNIIVRSSLFADNANNLDIDRAEEVTVENVVIVGESPSFRNLMSRETGISTPCRNHRLIGLDLHTWKLHKQFGGATLRNLHISGFTDTACPRSFAIYIDGLVSFIPVETSTKH